MKTRSFKTYAASSLAAAALLFSCTKTEVNNEEAACEQYLLGLSYECVDNTCTYTARIENQEGNGEYEMEIDQATYDHYKTEAEQKQENVCWNGVIE